MPHPFDGYFDIQIVDNTTGNNVIVVSELRCVIAIFLPYKIIDFFKIFCRNKEIILQRFVNVTMFRKCYDFLSAAL